MDTFAKRLEIAMASAKMRPAELSKITGIGKSSISAYMSGQYIPKQKHTFLIATALHVKPSFLMGIDPINSISPIITKPEHILLDDFRRLNTTGQEKALDYIHDLTENTKYTEGVHHEKS